jgi:hypothetical protein
MLCHCSKHNLNPRHCSWVLDGRPCCSETCFNQALARQGHRERARAARDVPIGTSWAFQSHRTMQEADHGRIDVI